MQIDLTMVAELCGEVGFEFDSATPDQVAIHLEPGVVLLFVNFPADDDNLIGFDGTQWHFHDSFEYVDREGMYAELDYLDVVTGLADGSLLICESWLKGELADRWLVHREDVDEFDFLRDDEEIRIRAVSKRARGGMGAP